MGTPARFCDSQCLLAHMGSVLVLAGFHVGILERPAEHCFSLHWGDHHIDLAIVQPRRLRVASMPSSNDSFHTRLKLIFANWARALVGLNIGDPKCAAVSQD